MQTSNKDESGGYARSGLVDTVLSWPFKHIFNKNLYKAKVKEIPMSFESEFHYMDSFKFPLLEETRTELFSEIQNVPRAPYCVISSIELSKYHKLPNELYYEITTKVVHDSNGRVVGRYEPESGDLFAVTNIKPKKAEDINSPLTGFVVAYVQRMKDENTGKISILASKPVTPFGLVSGKQLYAVYVGNLTTNVRVWKALHPDPGVPNSKIIEDIVSMNCLEDGPCMRCFSADGSDLGVVQSSELDDSQKEAVSTVVKISQCNHESSIKLIWGPPGTGKTKTVATFLVELIMMSVRTVVCAPTNMAVLQVASRLRKLLNGEIEHEMYGLGDVVLFGNEKRMKIEDHKDLLDVFLDHRTVLLSKAG